MSAEDRPPIKRRGAVAKIDQIDFRMAIDAGFSSGEIADMFGISAPSVTAFCKQEGFPMPESVTDRCTKAHEYVFMLSKGPRYFYDQDAIAEPVTDSTIARVSQPTLADQVGSDRVPGKTNGNMKAVLKQDGHGRRHAGFNDRYFGADQKPTRNRRSVWTVSTKPFKGAHFATFPPDLIEPCILAGSPVGGTVLDPFGGSGTTAGVAMRNGRNSILCELNPEYAALMPDRILSIAGDTPDMFREAAE